MMASRTHLKVWVFLWMTTAMMFLNGAVCKHLLLELPPTMAPPVTEMAGLRGYARFHANDSHVGQPVPCTHDEKVCLRHNLIFDPKTDRCQPPGGGGHGCYLRASRTDFEHGSGHIVGVCQKYDDPCSYGLRLRMAYDGRCYDHKVVFNDLCAACESGPTLHFLGGWECRCSPSEPVQIEQPEEEGKCLVPDFRERHPPTSDYFDHPLTTVQRPKVVLNCTDAEQRRCFDREKVWVEGAQGCHSLLKRGPCPADHVVAMDGRAAEQRRAEATCVHVRGGCPEGQIRLAFDGQCHVQRDITIAAPGVVQLNVYGIYEVLDYAQSVLYTPLIREDKCVVEFLRFWPPFTEREGGETPPCGPSDKSQCSLLEVLSTPPPPESKR